MEYPEIRYPRRFDSDGYGCAPRRKRKIPICGRLRPHAGNVHSPRAGPFAPPIAGPVRSRGDSAHRSHAAVANTDRVAICVKSVGRGIATEVRQRPSLRALQGIDEWITVPPLQELEINLRAPSVE